MKKILIIEICNHCRYFDDGMHGARCFYNKYNCNEKRKYEVLEEFRKDGSFYVDIPSWCKLENIEED